MHAHSHMCAGGLERNWSKHLDSISFFKKMRNIPPQNNLLHSSALDYCTLLSFYATVNESLEMPWDAVNCKLNDKVCVWEESVSHVRVHA